MLFGVVSCKKEKDYQLEIRVVSENKVPISGEHLDVFDENLANPEKSKVTGNDGLLTFKVEPDQRYYIKLTNYQGSGNGVYKFIGNIDASYFSKTTFQSQQEILSSPKQTPAGTVGNPKYVDFNHDGAIELSDLIVPINISSSETVKTIILILKDR